MNAKQKQDLKLETNEIVIDGQERLEIEKSIILLGIDNTGKTTLSGMLKANLHLDGVIQSCPGYGELSLNEHLLTQIQYTLVFDRLGLIDKYVYEGTPTKLSDRLISILNSFYTIIYLLPNPSDIISDERLGTLHTRYEEMLKLNTLQHYRVNYDNINSVYSSIISIIKEQKHG